MQLETTLFRANRGWKKPLPTNLDGSSTLVIAFGSSDLGGEDGPLVALRDAFPGSVLVGCSTAGEIFETEIDDGTVSVAVARFEHTRLARAEASVSSGDDSRAAGQQLARALAGPGLKGVLVLSDGLKVNGTELVRGLNESLPEEVTVTGGLAGDGSRFARTWVLSGGRPTPDRIVAVGFYGDQLHFGHGSKGGWDIFGPERLVTRSSGNVLYELDGKPALALYKTYLADRAAGLPATGLLFPLQLRSDDDNDSKRLVRTILAVDEATQSLTFAGDIPQGARAQLMRANMERLVEGAADAARMIGAEPPGDEPVLSIAISCVGRRLVLGERTEEEVEAALDVLPEGTRQVGFYSYGELSPFAHGRCDLHNQTMTLTTLWEA